MSPQYTWCLSTPPKSDPRPEEVSKYTVQTPNPEPRTSNPEPVTPTSIYLHRRHRSHPCHTASTRATPARAALSASLPSPPPPMQPPPPSRRAVARTPHRGHRSHCSVGAVRAVERASVRGVPVRTCVHLSVCPRAGPCVRCSVSSPTPSRRAARCSSCALPP